MPFRTIENEADFEIADHHGASPEVSQFVHGLDLPSDVARALATNALAARSAQRQERASSRAGSRRGSKGQLSQVSIEVGGLGLTASDEPAVETAIRELIDENARLAQGVAASDACVCMAVLPGRSEDLNEIDPPPWVTKPGNYPYVIAAYFPHPTTGLDIFRIEVTSGAGRIGSDETLVGLSSRVSWAKEIWAVNYCVGRIASVFVAGPTAKPPYLMRLERPNCRSGANTIVFRKPMTFGIWHDFMYFNAAQFWRVFAGQVVDFHWFRD